MKIFVPVLVAAATISTASGASFVDSLTPINNTDSYHMTPVRMVHARVQSDAPLWNDTTSTFGSKYYTTAETQFRGLLDTVNTASVEGALMYVQAEGINYNTRSADTRCVRKNNMKYVVFYDIVFAQPNETLAEYASDSSTKTEYGPMLPMDGGQCTPISGTSVFSKECVSLNGNASIAQIGPFIGGESKETDVRAPYPNCWWYSFPNSCPLSKWGAAKSDACRASTRQGLCDMNKLPDGITCTYNYRVLGYIPIDDVVGITSMTNAANVNYANFSDFCLAGGVEFNATTDTGTWIDGIEFWKNPQNQAANSARTTIMLSKYASMLSTKTSSQISSDVIGHMKPLPTVAELTTANPPCYKNVKACATATHGCKRDLYSQICTVCNSMATGCEMAPTNFTYPTLTKATIAASTTAGSSSGTPSATTAAPTTTPTSSAATIVMTVGALVASFGLSVLLG